MASELHNLIEEEIKNKELKDKKYKGSDEEKALMGALRVEARVKEHQHHKKVLTLKRSICIGGGLLVVIVLWIVLALKSKSASKPGIEAGGPPALPPASPPPSPPLPTQPEEDYPDPGVPTVDEETAKNFVSTTPAGSANDDTDTTAPSPPPPDGSNSDTASKSGPGFAPPPSQKPLDAPQPMTQNNETSPGRRRLW